MSKTKWYAKLLYLLVAVVLSLGVVAVPGNVVADGEVTFFSEGFEGGLPVDWTVLATPVVCLFHVCYNWTDSNPCNRTAYDGCSGMFMIADSDCCAPDGSINTELRTPSIDCSGYDTVMLEFDHWFYRGPSAPNCKGDVHISTDGGLTWTNILAYRADASGHVSIEISAQAAGESDVIIRWRDYDAAYQCWWEVDNVKLSGTAGPTPPGPPPPSVPAVDHWGIVAMMSLFGGFLVWTVRRRRPAL